MRRLGPSGRPLGTTQMCKGAKVLADGHQRDGESGGWPTGGAEPFDDPRVRCCFHLRGKIESLKSKV